MEIFKNPKTIHTLGALLVVAHTLVLYMVIFMTEQLDNRFGQVGSLLVLVLSIIFCFRAFKIKSPIRHVLLVTTFFMSLLGTLVLLVFLINCI